MRRPRWWVLVLVLLFAWLLVGTDCKSRPLRETSIVSFEITPNPVAPGGSVRIAWQAEHVGLHEGVSYCTLQRDVAGEVELEEVHCVGSREDAIDASIAASYIDYQFGALRRSGGEFVTRVIRLLIQMVVAVEPASVTLEPLSSQDFTATVAGASDRSVTWDASCGSISGSGSTITYTAPPTLDVCEVTATSVANPGVSASAIVTLELETYDVALLFWLGAAAAVAPYEAGLEARGFDVEPVILGSSESVDSSLLAAFDLLLIDPFTGSLGVWAGDLELATGDPTIVPRIIAAVENSGRPVVGLGEGGASFFGTVGSPLGWPNSMILTALDSFVVVEPVHPSLMGPRNVGIAGGTVGVVSPGVRSIVIYVPSPAPPLELVGRAGPSYPNHYVVLIDGTGVGSALWGYHDVPSRYSDDGWNVLADLMSYLIAAP